MSAVQSAFGAVIDLFLYPFRSLSPVWGLVVVSILSGLVLVKIFGIVSPQQIIKRTKRKITQSLLESVLFRHNTGLALKAQARMLRGGVVYFCLAVPPVLIMMLPCIFLLAQLNLRFGSRDFKLSERGVLTVTVEDPALLSQVKLESGPEINVTPPIRIAEEKRVVWRVDSTVGGTHQVRVLFGGDNPALEIPITAAASPRTIESAAYESWWLRLLYPSRLLLDSSIRGIESVTLSYPEQLYSLFGWHTSWIVVFLLVSLVSGLIGSKFLGVEI